jgi:hypothetical protein
MSVALLALIAVAPPPPQAPLRVEVAACRQAVAAPRRRVTFRATADVRGEAVRVALRVDLEQHVPGRRGWSPVRAGTFGRWVLSERGRPALVVSKHVVGLAAPAAYRAVVRARWLDAERREVAVASRTTQPCRMPDPRPDLVPVSVHAEGPARDGVARYVVRVRNAGAGGADAFNVSMTPPGARGTFTGRVPLLRAGRARDVVIDGAACAPGEVVQVLVDSDREVEEPLEDNLLEVACPLS